MRIEHKPIADQEIIDRGVNYWQSVYQMRGLEFNSVWREKLGITPVNEHTSFLVVLQGHDGIVDKMTIV